MQLVRLPSFFSENILIANILYISPYLASLTFFDFLILFRIDGSYEPLFFFPCTHIRTTNILPHGIGRWAMNVVCSLCSCYCGTKNSRWTSTPLCFMFVSPVPAGTFIFC